MILDMPWMVLNCRFFVCGFQVIEAVCYGPEDNVAFAFSILWNNLQTLLVTYLYHILILCILAGRSMWCCWFIMACSTIPTGVSFAPIYVWKYVPLASTSSYSICSNGIHTNVWVPYYHMIWYIYHITSHLLIFTHCLPSHHIDIIPWRVFPQSDCVTRLLSDCDIVPCTCADPWACSNLPYSVFFVK